MLASRLPIRASDAALFRNGPAARGRRGGGFGVSIRSLPPPLPLRDNETRSHVLRSTSPQKTHPFVRVSPRCVCRCVTSQRRHAETGGGGGGSLSRPLSIYRHLRRRVFVQTWNVTFAGEGTRRGARGSGGAGGRRKGCAIRTRWRERESAPRRRPPRALRAISHFCFLLFLLSFLSFRAALIRHSALLRLVGSCFICGLLFPSLHRGQS